MQKVSSPITFPTVAEPHGQVLRSRREAKNGRSAGYARRWHGRDGRHGRHGLLSRVRLKNESPALLSGVFHVHSRIQSLLTPAD